MLIENYGVKEIKRYFIIASNQFVEIEKHLVTGAFFLGTILQFGGF